jgi:hypothetical protein
LSAPLGAALAGAIDYGVLGDPQNQRAAWITADPDFDRQTPKEKLALFRHHEQHPRQGALDAPVPWSQIQQDEALQRALYYSVLKDAPHMIEGRDRKWIERDEAFLVRATCAHRGEADPLFTIPPSACPTR